VLFVEKSAEKMLNIWLVVDHISRPIIALFASGSAITGWSMWNSENGKIVWAAMAGLAALLSIVTSTLGIQDRVKRFTETLAIFLRMRLRLECLLSKMRLNPEFETEEVEKDFIQFQEQYAEACPAWPHDIFFTEKLRNKVQTLAESTVAASYA